MIKYRLVEMYNKTVFQIEKLDNIGTGTIQIRYHNSNGKLMYSVEIGSMSYIAFNRTVNRIIDTSQPTSHFVHFSIRLDGTDTTKKNDILIINHIFNSLENKVFHHAMKTWSIESSKLPITNGIKPVYNFNIEDIL